MLPAITFEIDDLRAEVVLRGMAAWRVIVGGRWQPGIGDSSFMGWLTVVLYFGAACLSFLAFTHQKKGSARVAMFWILLSALLFLLGLNKQLDIQTLFTEIGKDVALVQGWYEKRRAVQAIFIVFVGLSAIVFTLIVYWLAKERLKELRLALLGAFFLLAFITIRASSFHHVDELLGFRLVGLKLNWVLEISGILCVMFSAAASSGLTERVRRIFRDFPDGI